MKLVMLGLVGVALTVGCGGGGEGRRQARGPADEPPAGRQGPPPGPPAGRLAGAGPAAERRDDARDKKVEAATNWDKLGERMVDGKGDKDTIAVGRGDGRFSAIQLKVEQSALELLDVVVTFGDGSTFSPPTRLVFGNGTTSRVIDLPGDKRVIKKVDFKYANLPKGGRAQIELWAR